MASRYSTGRFSLSNDPNPCPEIVRIEEADLFDNRTGDVFGGGAVRVRLLVPVEGFRTKTFKGESAWSVAQRLANYIAFKAQRDGINLVGSPR